MNDLKNLILHYRAGKFAVLRVFLDFGSFGNFTHFFKIRLNNLVTK